MTQTPDTFDPYHQWLGIPPEEQPASHYRLLGIRELEDDADVIDHGANRCMAHVRTFQSGPRSLWSQKLLNKLAAARVCLLNPEQKKDYDTVLLQQRRTQPPALPIPQDSAEPPPRQEEPAVTPSTGKSYLARGRTPARRRKHQQNARIASLVTLLVILAALAVIAIQIFS